MGNGLLSIDQLCQSPTHAEVHFPLNAEAAMKLLAGLTDPYEFRARLQPVLLVAMPMALTTMVFFEDFSLFQLLAGILASLGFTSFLSQIARDQGRQKETGLFEAWDGKPTTQLLRHRCKRISELQKKRYHEAIEQLAGVNLPSEREENEKPSETDEVYEVGAAFLREKTRDRSRFPLIAHENMNYGFRRNLWGMKPVGIVLSIAGLIASIVGTIWFSTTSVSPISIAAILVNASMVAAWFLRITPGWVKTPAFAYAERLLASCDTLVESVPKQNSEIFIP